jgi:metal-dependent amidase/aminoacylase/carboxypeptidase family protein
VTGFLALAHVLKKFGIEGRVQLLGTPAEEDGGGKIDLLNAGAYERVDVSLMMYILLPLPHWGLTTVPEKTNFKHRHPQSDADYTRKGALGSAGFRNVASHNLQGTYHGVKAHAGAEPWEGINALDALVSTYVSVSMLRQQIKPTERIHGSIVEAPKPTQNSIPALTKILYTTRSPTTKGARKLGERIRQCMEGGALAAGCKLEIEEMSGYAELRVNEPLCDLFQKHMTANGIHVLKSEGPIAAATDQGNVSYSVPALHAIIGVPVDDGSKIHTAGFARAAGSTVAFERAIVCGKAMAMTGWDIITKDVLFAQVWQGFEKDKMLR